MIRMRTQSSVVRALLTTSLLSSACGGDTRHSGASNSDASVGGGSGAGSEAGASSGSGSGGSNGDSSSPPGSGSSSSGSDSSGSSSGSISASSGSAPDAGSADGGGVIAPTGLLTNLLARPETTVLTDATPRFSWIVNASGNNQVQTAYRVLVSSSRPSLDSNSGDMWDSGETASAESIHVVYAGKPLSAGATYFWKVQTWDSAPIASAWSTPQSFVMAATLGTYQTATEPAIQTLVAPTQVTAAGTGHYLVDFGRDAFGWAELTINAPAAAALNVNIGEKGTAQGVDLAPGGTIRHAQSTVMLQPGVHTYRIATPTNAPGIALPASLGNVMPFRFVEILNSPVAITADAARQVALTAPYDPTASSFKSSNTNLDTIWDFSKYTMFATTFEPGLYVDGDRERKPYEGDAYIHQLGHYAVDRHFVLPRSTHEYLLTNPTWPTEWKEHSIMLAWTDWMYTGNTDSLAQAYNILSTQKLLTQYVQADGLVNTQALGCTSTSCGPMVDWPINSRDGFVMTNVNTVINAFYCRNLQQMADIATALGKTADAVKYTSMANAAITTMNQKMVDATTGLYVDGETATHSSLHANMFPLALGLVPASRVAAVTAFVKSRGMACSVYGAQYLLEALYQVGEADAALSLMTANTLQSWNNMLKVGATMTMEAWDISIKPNLDWNHPWGAAPANIVARYLLGVKPLTPGFASAALHPQLGSLTHAEGVVPTIRGPIQVVLTRGTGSVGFSTSFTLPANMTADVALPAPAGMMCKPLLDGQPATALVKGANSWVASVGSGAHEIHCQ